MLAPLTAACLAAAAHAYQLPEVYLYAILQTEGGRIGQAVINRNGTEDLGPFQINSSWGSALAIFLGMPVDQALARVRDDGCANAVAAAAILKNSVIDSKGDLPTALGLFHSHNHREAERYRKRASALIKAMDLS